MPSVESSGLPLQRRPSVFLSYASEDRPAARVLRDALTGCGLEVWYDESELDGGDAWDQKIRRQIRACDYFMPVVSATTEVRHEGYFRREWRLAVERTLDMADDHIFLLPVVIDETDTARARVPEKFLSVQWVRVPGGQSTPDLQALCRRLLSPKPSAAPPPPRPAPHWVSGSDPGAGLAQSGDTPPPDGVGPTADSSGSPAGATASPSARTARYPQFPREEPGQRVRFWFDVAGWALRSGWIAFQQLPRWVRWFVYCWLLVAVLHWCAPDGEHTNTTQLSPAAVAKLKAISDQYQGSSNTADIAKLGSQIAREFSDAVKESTANAPVLAIPFTAPPSDPAAAKLADSTFAEIYGRVSISHHGRVGLSENRLASLDVSAAVEQGRANHSTYVVCGAVDTQTSGPTLTIKVAAVGAGSVVWSKSYPVTGADPAQIAAEVAANVPSAEDDD